jgi:hypothetical protein
MPEKYKPTGSSIEFTVPSLDDPADGPQAFRDFADTIPQGLAAAVPIHPKTADYSLLLEDDGCVVTVNTSTANHSVTVPAHSKVAFPIGAVVVVGNVGTKRDSVVNLVADAGVTIRDISVRTINNNHLAALIQIEQDSWIINAGTGGAPKPATPGAPVLVSVVAGPASAVLTWTKPSDDGGSPLTGYVVETSSDAGKTWANSGNFSASELKGTVSNLKVVEYEFRVRASNTNGFSDPSNIIKVTPKTPWNAATGGTITEIVVGNKKIRRHIFTFSSNFVVESFNLPFTVYLLGGGGGGGHGGFDGGGPHGGWPGGGGGYFTFNNQVLTVMSYPINIGGGGPPGGYGGGPGGDTAAFGYVAGGGGGGAWGQDVQTGGDGRAGNPPEGRGGDGGGANHGVTDPCAGKQTPIGLASSIANGGRAGGAATDPPAPTAGVGGAVVVEYQIGDV